MRPNLFAYIIDRFEYYALSSIAILSSKWWFSVSIAIISFFEPVKIIVHLVIFAIIIDMLSGLIKAIVIKEKITSWRMRDTLIKLFFYVSIILLIFGIQKACFYNTPIVNLFGGLILFIETISIAENTDKMLGSKTGIADWLKILKDKFIKKNKENE